MSSYESTASSSGFANAESSSRNAAEYSDASEPTLHGRADKLANRSRCRSCKRHFENVNLLHAHIKDNPQCNMSPSKKLKAKAGPSATENALPAPSRAGNLGKGKQRAEEVEDQDTALEAISQAIDEAVAPGNFHESIAMQRGSSGGTTDGTTDPEQADVIRKQKRKERRRRRKEAARLVSQIKPKEQTSISDLPAEQRSELPSPSPSIASSTDELPYVPPRLVSHHSSPILPSPKVQDSSTQAVRIPFQQPFTAFDILSASHPNNPASTPAEIQAPAPSDLPRPNLYSHKSTPSTSSVVSTVKKTKKIPASPLVWGVSGSAQAIDAPTLGTTQTDMRSHSPESKMAPVYRASHAADKATIVQELARRMHAGLSLHSESDDDKLAREDSRPQSMDVKQPEGQAQAFEQADDDAGDTTLKPADEDGIVRKDTLDGDQVANKPESTEGDNAESMGLLLEALAAAPPEQNLQSGKLRVNGTQASSIGEQEGRLEDSPVIQEGQSSQIRNEEKIIQSVGETSAIQGILPTSTKQPAALSTTDGEEDDGTVSEASASSDMIRGVVRDLDDRSWDEGMQVPDLEKAKLRFGKAVIELDKRHRPTADTIRKRQEMLLAVQRLLNGTFANGHYHGPKYELRAFGSTAYGLDTDASDLDLCIIDYKRPDGFRNALDLYDLEPEVPMTSTDDEVGSSPVKKGRGGRSRSPDRNVGTQRLLDPVYDVKRLAGVLRRMGMREVTPIPTAGVPIVKFVDHAGIKSDMNANEQLGVRNSTLLAAYIKQSPLVRPFLIFLKLWAKQRGINDPSGQQGEMSLSSYSLVLLGLTYLQSINLIPNLQDIDLIKQSGMQRQAFWSKVLDKIAARSRSYNMRGKIAGDYKAMAIETTFLANMPSTSDWRPTWPSPEYHQGQQKNQSLAPTTSVPQASPRVGGWEDDSSAAPAFPPFETPADKAETASLLFQLIEGFFTYYSSFPIETQAISLWRGKPLQRQNMFDKAKTDTEDDDVATAEKGITDLSAEEREELYEEQAAEDEEEEVLPRNMKVSKEEGTNGQESSPETAYTDEESSPAVEALMAKLEARLEAAGVTDLGPRFDEIKPTVLADAAGDTQSGTDSADFETTEDEITDDTGNLTPRNTVFSREADQPAAIAAAAAAAQSGLSIEDADPNDNYRFPFPAQEDPENFVEPAIWTQKLVVQDPFIHTRNVCLNVKPPMVDRIMGEMHRAATMLREGAAIDSVCLSIRTERKRNGIPSPKSERSRERTKFKKERKREARASNNHYVKEWQDRESLKNRRQEERDFSKRGRGGYPAENGRGRGGYQPGPHFNKFSHQNEGYNHQGGSPGRGRAQGSPYRGAGRGKPPFQQRNKSPERA